MYKVNNLFNNPNITIADQHGPFKVLEYMSDMSVAPDNAMMAYYSAAMNVRQRQVICELSVAPITTQAGAMQWMLGDVNMVSGVRGVGNFLGNAIRGRVSGESAVKPEYTGTGLVALEPTYKFILLEDLDQWNGSMVVEDGMFLACMSSVQRNIVARNTVSSAIAGGEGLFNLCLSGSGVVCLESPYPREELVEVTLANDVLKIDGSMAVAWSKSLNFTVERSANTLVGSALSGEGLVNVYRGTGKVLLAPVHSSLTAMPPVAK